MLLGQLNVAVPLVFGVKNVYHHTEQIFGVGRFLVFVHPWRTCEAEPKLLKHVAGPGAPPAHGERSAARIAAGGELWMRMELCNNPGP